MFIEQTYPLPKLREVMKCSKKYGETEDVPNPTNPTNPKPHDTDLDNDTDETAHAD